jgi:hypothetical protein
VTKVDIQKKDIEFIIQRVLNNVLANENINSESEIKTYNSAKNKISVNVVEHAPFGFNRSYNTGNYSN